MLFVYIPLTVGITSALSIMKSMSVRGVNNVTALHTDYIVMMCTASPCTTCSMLQQLHWHLFTSLYICKLYPLGTLSADDANVEDHSSCSVSGAVCRGDGFQFDQVAFVGSQGRNEKAQNFARMFRHSQLYEVFINERLKLASQDYKTSDNFESKASFC